MMELKATNHSYYCNDGNYYSNEAYGEFNTWQDFREAWFHTSEGIDHDYNHCFRFDIKPLYDHENDIDFEDRFSLSLYMMLQRKGAFIPVEIKEIKKEDMKEIEDYLQSCWDYIKGQWMEFSK